MPLSEDEQRILDQIESQLYETDPGLVRGIADTTVYSLARRRLLLAVGGLLVGFALLLGTLQTEGIGFLLAFGGFVIMVLASMSIEANLRRLGKAGIDQLSRSMSSSGLRDYFGAARQRPGDPVDDDELDDDERDR